mgnify:CR=1 FL=1
MNARTKIHQLHLNEWITRFSEQKASGLTVKQWCEQNHLSVHAYNYWKHLVKEDLSSQVLPDIVPLAFPNSERTSVPTESSTPVFTNCPIRAIRTTATITINGISITVDSGISEDFLHTLIKAVRHA